MNSKAYSWMSAVIGGLIGLVLAQMFGAYIERHMMKVLLDDYFIPNFPIASILVIVGGITVIILGLNRTKGVVVLIGGLLLAASGLYHIGLTLLFGLFGNTLGKPLDSWAENKKLERQRLAEEQRKQEEARREAERSEQERRESERRREEEERRKREEEERRRLEGMKQEIIDKIDEVIKK